MSELPKLFTFTITVEKVVQLLAFDEAAAEQYVSYMVNRDHDRLQLITEIDDSTEWNVSDVSDMQASDVPFFDDETDAERLLHDADDNVMPSHLCVELDLPAGSTFAQGREAAFRGIPRSQDDEAATGRRIVVREAEPM